MLPASINRPLTASLLSDHSPKIKSWKNRTNLTTNSSPFSRPLFSFKSKSNSWKNTIAGNLLKTRSKSFASSSEHPLRKEPKTSNLFFNRNTPHNRSSKLSLLRMAHELQPSFFLMEEHRITEISPVLPHRSLLLQPQLLTNQPRHRRIPYFLIDLLTKPVHLISPRSPNPSSHTPRNPPDLLLRLSLNQTLIFLLRPFQQLISNLIPLPLPAIPAIPSLFLYFHFFPSWMTDPEIFNKAQGQPPLRPLPSNKIFKKTSPGCHSSESLFWLPLIFSDPLAAGSLPQLISHASPS